MRYFCPLLSSLTSFAATKNYGERLSAGEEERVLTFMDGFGCDFDVEGS